jgi:membrane-associated phospholipid phosphatase
VRSSEWVSFVYFAALTAIAWLRPLPSARRVQITAIGLLSSVAVVTGARLAAPAVRDWMPPLVILAGYFLSGRFFVNPSPSFEAWLIAWDRRLLGDPATRFAHWPRALLAYLEIVYMGCVVLVPAGFAALAWTGRSALADSYWTLVTAAEFGSFASLGVVQARPPWMVERKAVLSDRSVHRAASMMVEHLTIRANTFPSGHVAGSLAAALAVMRAMPGLGLVLLFLAGSIAAACIVGRYHYIADVVTGVLLTVLIWSVVT